MGKEGMSIEILFPTISGYWFLKMDHRLMQLTLPKWQLIIRNSNITENNNNDDNKFIIIIIYNCNNNYNIISIAKAFSPRLGISDLHLFIAQAGSEDRGTSIQNPANI